MIKRVLKIAALLLMVVLIAIQFIPVERSNPPVDLELDLLEYSSFTPEQKQLVKAACYDCHSNETVYPWYSYVAPMSFSIEHHVIEGREELNFNTFMTYSDRKKDHKLEEVIEALKEGWMPLNGYVALHSEAKLSNEQRADLAAAFAELRTKMQRGI